MEMLSFFKTKTFAYAFTVAAALLAATGALAWTGPGARAPGDNSGIGTFLNTSATAQTKSGDLQSTTAFVAPNVTANQYCIGVSCISSWAGASGSWTTSGNNIYNSNTGNVGIGTAAPASRLHVLNSGGASTVTIGATSLGAGNVSSGVNMYAQYAGTLYTGSISQGSSNMFISAGGGTVMFSSPIAALGGNPIYAYDPTTTKILTIKHDGTNAVFTNSNGGFSFAGGNVGIGTPSPGAKLDVVGTSHVTGASTLDSDLVFTQGASTRNVGMYGTYDPTKLAAIWSMGTSYKIGADGTAGNLYGLNYSYEPNYGGTGNNPGAIAGLGHQMQWRANGATQTAIGTGIYTTGTITANGAITSAGAVTASAFYYSSDARLKKNIETISQDKALADILALNPVTYNWKDTARGSGTQLGFIAQEVEKVVPELVTTDASTTMKAVDYARVAPLLVGALQAQQTRIDTQQKQIDRLEAEVAELKALR